MQLGCLRLNLSKTSLHYHVLIWSKYMQWTNQMTYAQNMLSGFHFAARIASFCCNQHGLVFDYILSHVWVFYNSFYSHFVKVCCFIFTTVSCHAIRTSSTSRVTLTLAAPSSLLHRRNFTLFSLSMSEESGGNFHAQNHWK